MNNALLKLYIKFQDLMQREEGQDLIEYALIGALVSVAAVGTLKTLGTTVSGVFTTLTGDL